ncbi:AMP-binding protein, partial [Streptomyces sp. F8]|uniref:AMP-binding protein n=1 Tax=Streptomyces sp. F8 TaxID=1436085 RepID=UPI003FA7D835
MHPDAVAVRHGATRLDYAALDRWSEAIAHRLRDRGVGHGDPVAVCVARGPAAVAGVLGVLKAGAHYIPVDPAAPAERTRTVLADAKVRHALVDESAELPVPLELVNTGSAAPVREVPSLALSS